MFPIKKITNKYHIGVRFDVDENGEIYTSELETTEIKNFEDLISSLHEFGHIVYKHPVYVDDSDLSNISHTNILENKCYNLITGDEEKYLVLLKQEVDAWLYAFDCVKEEFKGRITKLSIESLASYTFFANSEERKIAISYFCDRINRFSRNSIKRIFDYYESLFEEQLYGYR
jgi:hypothetical protein